MTMTAKPTPISSSKSLKLSRKPCSSCRFGRALSDRVGCAESKAPSDDS